MIRHGRDRATPEDIARWRALIAAAERAAASPAAAPAKALITTIRQAKQAVVPVGEITRDNAFIRLHRLADRYAQETSAGRQQLQAELGEAAGKCAALLQPNASRARTDIEG